MEEYVGKICPYCKTEIKEGDAVKVCPECGIPHHAVCWEENKGCSTLGCPKRYEDKQQTTSMDVCPKCGTPLDKGQEFCPKCGTPRNEAKKLYCNKCGAEVQEDQEFCSKCGQKLARTPNERANTSTNQSYAGTTDENKRPRKGKVIGLVVIIVALLAAIGLFAAPKLFVSLGDLCEQGNYIKAYEKASADEKNAILAEGVVAYLSNESVDMLKDPSSFVLREGYYRPRYDEEEDQIYQGAVLYISGKNTYGGNVSSYWLWLGDECGVWNIVGTCSSLNLDKDDDDYTVALLASMTIGDKNVVKLSKESVLRINSLFKSDKLDSVELIDVSKIDKSTLKEAK